LSVHAIALRDEAAAVGVALVRRAQGGDRAAFEQLIRPRLDRLLRLAISITSDESDARDVVQDGCLLAWRQLPRLRDPDRFEAWLWRIVVNASRTRLRERRRTSVRELTVGALAPEAEPAERGPAFADQLSMDDAIRRAFARLDPDKRSILVLHHVEERPLAEIAALLAIPEGTAKSRLHVARDALARALKAEL
jgi:RNA polymerase sigma-70 factor (ECF subfamily)